MGTSYSTISRMVRIKFPKLEKPQILTNGKLNSLIDGSIIYMTKLNDVYKSNLIKGIASVMLTNQVASGNAWHNTMYAIKERFDRLVTGKVVWYKPYEPLHIVKVGDIDVSKVKDPKFEEWVDREAKKMPEQLPMRCKMSEDGDCNDDKYKDCDKYNGNCELKLAFRAAPIDKDVLDNLALATRFMAPSYAEWSKSIAMAAGGRFSSKEPNIQELPKEAPFEECPDCLGTCEELCGHASHHISTKTTCDRTDCHLGVIPCQTCGGTGIKAKEQFKIKSKRRIRVEFGEEGKGVVNTVRNKHIVIKSEE